MTLVYYLELQFQKHIRTASLMHVQQLQKIEYFGTKSAYKKSNQNFVCIILMFTLTPKLRDILLINFRGDVMTNCFSSTFHFLYDRSATDMIFRQQTNIVI